MATLTSPTSNYRDRESYDPPKNHAEKVGRVLMGHYSSTAQGLTIIKREDDAEGNPVWSALTQPPSWKPLKLYYLGGHRHEISIEIGQQLVAAGFVTEVTDEEGQVVAFEGVADWSPHISEEPEEEPEGAEDL
jgi:hypothetical protein